MADIRTTTTNYIHPTDPNLLNIHKAMKFNSDGEPVVRTHVDGITLEGDVIVDTVNLSSSTLAALESVSVQNTVTVTVSNFPTTSTVYQGTSPWVVTGTVNVTTTQTDVTIADSNYFFNIARGRVDSQYLEFKNGYCGNMSSSAAGYTIWNEGTLYPWSSWTTSQRLYIASSSASDTGQTILIKGLNSSYQPISETITTSGLTNVATTNTYLRVNNTIVIGGTENVGTIHTHLGSSTGTVVGSMAPGIGRNKQAVFTVPAGHTAYILYGDVSSYKNGSGNVSGQVDMRVRTNNGGTVPFINAFAGIAANGQFRSDFPVPFAVPEKSDIEVRFAASGNGTTVACAWEMVMIPN
jgi:hypothetical protein